MKKVAFSFLIVVLTLIHAKSVAQQAPAPGENAALQYYSAFLQMKDAEISDADVQELSEIIAGTKNYNEAKFGTLVDNNTEALRTMWAGAVLPTCDWGLGISPRSSDGKRLCRIFGDHEFSAALTFCMPCGSGTRAIAMMQ